MQPSSDTLHLGNYLGALTNWVSMQDNFSAYFCVVNQHAITVPQNPDELRASTRRTAAQYIAAGIDPDKSVLFVQSQVAAHAELAWVLSTLTGFGEASRMTQFKDKSQKQGSNNTSVGLFTYPVLMAADILLYQTESVPVGDDQKQHIELTRNLAQKFNAQFGETFVVPEPFIPKEAARIYDLQSPNDKMSKSTDSDAGRINLMDDPAITAKKFKRAVTDADGEIRFDKDAKPGVSNLLSIYSALSNRSIAEIESEFAGSGYGALKTSLAELAADTLGPIRQRTLELLDDPAELDRQLAKGAEKAREVANRTLATVY
ncbi:MAG: tryptophan--tRNA ligase, partial [Microbacteriaceae bacterium]